MNAADDGGMWNAHSNATAASKVAEGNGMAVASPSSTLTAVDGGSVVVCSLFVAAATWAVEMFRPVTSSCNGATAVVDGRASLPKLELGTACAAR